MEDNLPPGFRFHPTDEELVSYYLNPKVSDPSFTSRAIAEVDLNKCEPWDLPAKASMGEKEWYFFSLRDRKYPTGLRTNRATEAGYWKTTGKDKEIFRGHTLLGMKKTLVFYRGRAPRGEKTNWVMHEYRLQTNLSSKPSKEEWVVCRIFHKSPTAKKPQETQSSQLSADSPCDTNTIIANEFGDFELPNLYNTENSLSNAITHGPSQDYQVDCNAANTNMALNWSQSVSDTLSGLSTLLDPNFSVNSLLLKAMQLKSYHSRETANLDYSCIPQDISQYGNDFTTNLSSAPYPRVLDSVQQEQQQPPPPPPNEQLFNLEPIW